MAKSETLSTAAKPADLDKAYASATKALSVLGIKMTTKKPDPVKIGTAMAGNKKAFFKLGGDAKLMKMTVECDGTVNTLGIFDVAAERDLQKRVVILQSLSQSGFDVDKELKAAEKELKGGPDPKALANIKRETETAQKTIADAKKTIVAYEGMKSWDSAKKSTTMMKELEAYAKKTHAEENILFLKAIDGKMDNGKVIAAFIVDGAKYQVDVDGKLRQQIIAGTKDASAGFDWIKKDVEQNLISKVFLAKKAEQDGVISAANKKIDNLAALKKKLEAA